MKLTSHLRSIWQFMERENLHRLVIIIGVLIIFGSFTITWAEPDITLINGLWWSVVTLTTVGYGDISPVTMGGRIVATIMMLFGVGLLGLFSATIAGVMVDRKIKEDRGMNSYDLKNHIIICEWNHRAWVVLNELRADPTTSETPIVVIADIDRKPVDDDDLYFIQGDVTDETLYRADVAAANTAVILGEDELDLTTRDAKVVLTALAVESINSEVYTIVEIADESNVRHCQRANADEIIVTSELSASLLARAALNHGITKVVTEILSSGEGHEMYKLPILPAMSGRLFLDVFTEVKEKHQSIIMAVQNGEMGPVIINPPTDYKFKRDDHLIIVAENIPAIFANRQ